MFSSIPINYESIEKPGKSVSEVFWLRIMNDIIRPRFLKVKQKQENQCMQLNTFQQFYQCYQYQSDRLQQDTVEMEFFAKKFDTCIQQGTKALYPLKRVEDICSNKLINIIKQQTSLRRHRIKQSKQLQQKKIQQQTKNNQISQQKSNPQENFKIQGQKINQSIDSQRQGKFINGYKLSWQEQKSLQNMENHN